MMLHIERAYEPLDDYLEPNKVLVIYGPRRAGKTTLVQNYLKETSFRYKLDSGDNIRTQEVLSSSDFNLIKSYCENYELIVIDEAQNIPDVGKGLKIIIDQIPNIRVIATGSSSFDLSSKIGEPLVGRKRVLKLFPISISELKTLKNTFEIQESINDFLIFGLYPEIFKSSNEAGKREYLNELVNSYLLKDILAMERVKSPKFVLDLLRLLAFQVGSQVSLNELSNSLKVDVKTISRYLDLLEKSFIIIPLGGFSTNLRKEVTSLKKYYFYDNGIRNGVINAFNQINQRDDRGKLWENFLFIERMKKKAYTGIYSNDFYWRTYRGSEIDLIEERDGDIFGFEFKWKAKNYAVPNEWKKRFPEKDVTLISGGNFLDFIT